MAQSVSGCNGCSVSAKQPMLSITHAIFKGLQEHLRDIIASLPQSISPTLKNGLVDAHLKLSTYYGRSDQSPFHTWAASE